MGAVQRAFTTEPDDGDSRQDIKVRLESARGAIERRFLAAGDILSSAIEGANGLISALEHLTAELDPAAIRATSEDLNAAAVTLLALPQRLAERQVIITDLERRRGELTDKLADMRRSFAFMRAFTMNIKITAGGIPAADVEFGLFAHEISSRIESGRSEIEGLSAQLDALHRLIGQSAKEGQRICTRCEDLVPVLTKALSSSASAMGEHHGRIAETAASAAAVARDIRKRVSRILAALQIGDITRQRIEHVQAGVAMIEAEDPSTSDPVDLGVRHRMLELLGAQIKACLEDFDRQVDDVIASMAGLAEDAGDLLRLRDLAYGSKASVDGGVLRSLGRRIEDAAALVEEIRAAERVALETGEGAAKGAGAVAQQLAAIQSIKSDVIYMALNTALKSSRIGDAGRPLATIATELRLHAGRLEAAANQSLAMVADLTQAAAGITGTGPGSGGGRSPAEDAGEALTNAGRRIRDAGDRTEKDVLLVAEKGDAVLALLEQSDDRFRFKAEIGSILEQAAVELSAPAGERPDLSTEAGARLVVLLKQLRSLYTMQQERDLHDARIKAWGL